MFNECNPLYACPRGTLEQANICAIGYDGNQCGTCAIGYYHVESDQIINYYRNAIGLCQQCPDNDLIVYIAGAAVLIILIILLWLATYGEFIFKLTGVLALFSNYC